MKGPSESPYGPRRAGVPARLIEGYRASGLAGQGNHGGLPLQTYTALCGLPESAHRHGAFFQPLLLLTRMPSSALLCVLNVPVLSCSI